MIWGGAAETHMKRIERIQHIFLIWLCARCRLADVTLGYDELIGFFGLSTLAARREQHDAMFLRNIHRHSIDTSFLLSKFPLVAPTRLLRNRSVFHVPYARVNSQKTVCSPASQKSVTRFWLRTVTSMCGCTVRKSIKAG